MHLLYKYEVKQNGLITSKIVCVILINFLTYKQVILLYFTKISLLKCITYFVPNFECVSSINILRFL